RHDAALTVGGFLARAGLDEGEVALVLKAAAYAAGDEQGPDRVQAGRDAVKQYNNGGNTYGFPTLEKTFGEKVASKIAEWLNYQGASEAAPNQQLLAGVPPEQAKRITALISLEAYEYELQRKIVAEELGIRVTTLDDIVERLRPRRGPEDDGGRRG